MLLKRVGIVAIGAAVPMAACWACSSRNPTGAVDAAPDVAKADGVAPDSSLVDANADVQTDAHAPWLTGDWDPVPCPGATCTEYVARDPGASVGALKWRACTSGRVGCQELVVDWTTFKGTTLSLSSKQPVVVGDNGTPYLLLSKFYPERDYGASRQSIAVVFPLNAKAVFARAKVLEGSDILSWVLIGQAGVVHGIASEAARSQTYRMSVWSAPNTFAQSKISYAALGVGPGGSPGYGVPNGSKLFQFLLPVGQRVVDINAESSSSIGTTLDGPLAVPTGFVGLSLGPGLPLTYVKNDATIATLHSAPGGRTLSGFAIDEAAQHLVWAESADIAPASDSVLYEAPFAEKAADLVPRRVTAFDDPGGLGGGYMIANKGSALLRVSETRVIITSLTTGASWPIDADPGKNFLEPIWVDDNEVWLSVGTIRGNGADFDSIHRITRASLGAPTIPAK